MHMHDGGLRVNLGWLSAITLAGVCAGMVLGYEIARLDHDETLARLWAREPKGAS